MQPLVTIYDSLASVLLCAPLWRNNHIFKEHFHKGFFPFVGEEPKLGEREGQRRNQGPTFMLFANELKSFPLKIFVEDFVEVCRMGKLTVLIPCPASVWSWHPRGRPESHSLHNWAGLAIPMDLEQRACLCPARVSPFRADGTCPGDSCPIRESAGFQQLVASARRALTDYFWRWNYLFPPLWMLLNGYDPSTRPSLLVF